MVTDSFTAQEVFIPRGQPLPVEFEAHPAPSEQEEESEVDHAE